MMETGLWFTGGENIKRFDPFFWDNNIRHDALDCP